MREISGRFALKPLEEKRINVRGVKWRFFERLKAPEVSKILTICVIAGDITRQAVCQ